MLKTKNKNDGTEVNIMIDKIVSFHPLDNNEKGAGSWVLTTTGISYSVEASTRTIRGAINKHYGIGSDE